MKAGTIGGIGRTVIRRPLENPRMGFTGFVPFLVVSILNLSF
jgi:hypothetical protein